MARADTVLPQFNCKNTTHTKHVRASHLQRTVCALTQYIKVKPTYNVRASKTTVSSACKCCPPCVYMAIANEWERTCRHVVSTYHSLTTCATYDTHNRSPLDVACRPRTHTVSLTWVLSTHACHVLPKFWEKRSARSIQKTHTDKKRMAGCDGSITKSISCILISSIASQIKLYLMIVFISVQ